MLAEALPPAFAERWELLPPLQRLATHTGALALVGVFVETDGLACGDTLTLPVCTVTVGRLPVELTCTPAPGWFPPADEPELALEPPLDCEAFPPFEVEAMVTGAFAFTGAFAAADGLRDGDPAWLWPEVVEREPDVVCVLEVPLLVPAIVTGALAFTGALAEAAGLVAAAVTWAVPALTAVRPAGAPTDAFTGPVLTPPAASAGTAVHPSATSAAPSATMRFITVYSFRCRRTFQGLPDQPAARTAARG